jgi:hypothetical protein
MQTKQLKLFLPIRKLILHANWSILLLSIFEESESV